MFENIRLSFRGIRSHKMRSVLTMLGIIIGIAAIIIIVAIINGVSNQLKDSLVGDKTNTVELKMYAASEPYMAYDANVRGAIDGFSTIPEDALEAVKGIEGVANATLLYSTDEYSSNDIIYLDRTAGSSFFGVTNDYFNFSNMTLTEGRLITEHDVENRNNVVVLLDTTARNLFTNGSPLGRTVQIGNELFTVVGVVKENVDESDINSPTDYMQTFGYMGNGKAFVPVSAWSDIFGYDYAQSMLVQFTDADYIVTASEEAANTINSYLTCDTSKYSFKSGSLSEDSDSLNQIMNVSSILLVGIASISLLVGGIGVMNIMLVSVTERTREIGLKKALGAKKGVILGQFLTESVVLTSIGGIIGVLIGIGVSKLIGIIISLPTQVSVGSIALSVGFSMGVGIIFGLIPSIKAAKLNPIDALRYE